MASKVDGIDYLREDDQHFIEAIAEWLHADAEVDQRVFRNRGERRRALLVFQHWNHADVVMRELAQVLDLRRQKRDEYATTDGTILSPVVWTGQAQCGRYHDAIFMHTAVESPLARETMIPATPKFWNG